MRASKLALMAGISSLTLQLAVPAAIAADMATKAPLLPPPPPPTPAVTTWWGEGGWSGMTGGDPFIAGFTTPPFEVMPKRWGLQGAGGVDYKFASSPWHVSADFRYLQNGSNSATSLETAVFTAGTTTGANSGNRKEDSWEADFMVGRDLDVGGNSQLKFGLRVADIRGQTNGSAMWTMPIISPPTQTSNYQKTDKFFGAGPRLAIDGTILLQSAWSIDYNGGVAGLWAHRSVNQSVANVVGGFPGPVPVCTAGCPINTSYSNDDFIFNADGQIGLAYAFSKNAKISANYRIEYFGNALPSFSAGGSPTSLNRVYQGPTLKLTVAY
jgi:hypothetical protein